MTFSPSSKNPNSTPPTKKPQPRNPLNPARKAAPRRSRSVSAAPRTHLDTGSDFVNTRDNPLFWVDGSDLDDQFGVTGCGDGEESKRGRSVTRDSGFGGGRRLSTVNTRRYRSPNLGSQETERKQDSMPSKFKSDNRMDLNRNQSFKDGKTNIVRSASDLSELLKGCNTWSSQHPALETSVDSAINLTPHCDDGMLTRPFSEVEERTIEPVSEERRVIPWDEDNNTGDGILQTVRTEVRRAISDMHKDLKDAMLRSDTDIITDRMFSDDAPELENSDAGELVRDFREEFMRELEECEERTRKLRAELAVEEHRELELSNIVGDIIPEPETPQVHKPRLLRKGSSEKRKILKSLEEEAMAYFDECVSISTFDDSDFSSLEDPPSHKAQLTEPSDVPRILNRNNFAWSLESEDVIPRNPCIHSNDESNLSTSEVCNNSSRSSLDSFGRRPQFSFTSEIPESTSNEHGIRNCLKHFSKDKQQETSKSNVLRVVPPKTESYEAEAPAEEFLVDRMSFRSTIESGGMLLCGGGIGFPRTPFSSNFR